MTKHPLYSSWLAMMRRCYREGHKSFYNYGGRGIKVCERWHDVKRFIEDVGERPEGMTMDRINNNDDYAPDNFKWSTAEEQQRNTRRTRYLIHQGVKRPLTEWANQYGIHPSTLQSRLERRWPVEEALTRKLDSSRSMDKERLEESALI